MGVEYVVPVACTATPPEGFTGDDDEWEFMAEGLPIWAMRAAIWLPNPEGMFAEHNPTHTSVSIDSTIELEPAGTLVTSMSVPQGDSFMSIQQCKLTIVFLALMSVGVVVLTPRTSASSGDDV